MRNERSPYPWLKKSLNDFLESDACRRTVDPVQAKCLLGHLRRHRATIWTAEQFGKFIEDHEGEYIDGRCLKKATAHEIARGVETTCTIWEKHERWRCTRVRNDPPLRELSAYRSCFRR